MGEALRLLLVGSGLRAVALDSGGYVLRPDDTTAAALPTVRVRASALDGSADGAVKGFAARSSATGTKTGTKTETPLLEIPQSVSVIGREELVSRGVLNSGDALAYTPGVVPVLYGADDRMNSGDSGVTSRGFDSAAGSYLDGLRQPKSTTSWSYPRTGVHGMERIEVLRGPASTVFGEGDVGGVISRVSKRPDLEAPKEVTLQVGNFDRRGLSVDVGGGLDADQTVQWRAAGPIPACAPRPSSASTSRRP